MQIGYSFEHLHLFTIIYNYGQYYVQKYLSVIALKCYGRSQGLKYTTHYQLITKGGGVAIMLPNNKKKDCLDSGKSHPPGSYFM